MTDKEKADCLIALHTGQLSHFTQTRDLEFKVNLALWTLIAAGGGFIYEKGIHVETWQFALFAISVFVGHLCLWMIPIQQSEDKDDHYIRAYRKEIERLVGVELPQPAAPSSTVQKIVAHLRPSGVSWILAEVGLTGLLLIVVWFLVCN